MRSADHSIHTVIQGEEGSNSATAARELLGKDVRLVHCASFQEAFEALDKGVAGRAVLPIENTTAGIIQPVWDRLLGIDPGVLLAARAEARVRIQFVAAALPGTRESVRKILCHSVAQAQCRGFLSRARWAIVPCHDTAGAARLVREANDPSQAALCPPAAARTYELEVLEPECGDSSRTWTRFLLLEPGDAVASANDDRSILMFSLQDSPGALVKCLTSFAEHGVSLASLHSRAVPGHPEEYRFLMELRAGAADARCLAVFKELEKSVRELRIIGSYRTPAWPEATVTS